MAVQANIAPFINVTFWVTSEFWEDRSYYHKGIDIATATALGSQPVYSVCDGIVVRSEFTGSNEEKIGYGNVVIVKGTDGMGYLFAHLNSRDVSVGDSVRVGQKLGMEGETGEAYGMHLHFEMQDLTNHDWDYSHERSLYSNPADFMGIPNVEGTECFYNGTPYTPVVITTKKKHKYKFYLFKKKFL